jgi:hypothetical protein
VRVAPLQNKQSWIKPLKDRNGSNSMFQDLLEYNSFRDRISSDARTKETFCPEPGNQR